MSTVNLDVVGSYIACHFTSLQFQPNDPELEKCFSSDVTINHESEVGVTTWGKGKENVLKILKDNNIIRNGNIRITPNKLNPKIEFDFDKINRDIRSRFTKITKLEIKKIGEDYLISKIETVVKRQIISPQVKISTK